MGKSSLHTLISIKDIASDVSEIITETSVQIGVEKAKDYAFRLGLHINEELNKSEGGTILLDKLIEGLNQPPF